MKQKTKNKFNEPQTDSLKSLTKVTKLQQDWPRIDETEDTCTKISNDFSKVKELRDTMNNFMLIKLENLDEMDEFLKRSCKKTIKEKQKI